MKRFSLRALALAGALTLLALPFTAQAQLSDVTQPGDAITATSDNSPGSEGVTNAIDNAPTKYLNFDISNTGFTVTPSVGLTVVRGLSLQSANDAPDRDPVNYLLEGSYDGVDFTEISSGDVAAFPERFFTNYVFFDNNTAYLTYRLLFPDTAGPSTCCMQIAEVELLGAQAPADVTQPGDAIVATSDNSPGSEGVTNAIDNAPTKYLNFDIADTGFTVTPSVGMTVVTGLTLQSANDAPDRDPVNYLLEGSYDGVNFTEISSGDVAAFPERFFTNYIFFENSTPYPIYRLLFPLTAGPSTCCMQIAEVELLGSQAPGDVTQPGDTIVATSDNSPGSEGVTNAIDNAPTKYLNFDIADTGFTVTPSVGLTIVSGLSLQSANDAPDRDPVNYLLEGSYDGVNFTEISAGDVAAFPERFFTNYIFFDNSTAYLTYRLLFPLTAGARTCCMQIAEVEFLGVQLPGDITQPGDTIVATSDNSPGSEGVTNAIDNAPTKYLNFDITDTGFTVTPALGLTEVIGLSLQSANDAPDRDPVTYLLEGSYDGVNFTEISSGDVAPFPERFFTNYIFFDNATPYLTYRVIFPLTAGPSTCCMQIAEVELFPRPGGSCSDLSFVSEGLIRRQPENTPVLPGANATLQIVPTGPWNVQWFSKAPGADEFVEIAGATSANYTLQNVQPDADGTVFQAIVSTPGCEGQISNEATLSIFAPSDTVSIGLTWIGGGANGAPTSMNPEDIAGFHQQAYWNNVSGGGGDSLSIVDLDGNEAPMVNSNNEDVTGIDFEFETDGTWGVGTGDGNPTQRMLNGMVRTNTKDPEVDDPLPNVTFFGLPDGTYTLIAYSVQVPLEFFDMNYEVDSGAGTQSRFIRPQNSDEYNPSPGFVLVTAETEAARSVGNMVIFSDLTPQNGEIQMRYWAPNGDIQGPGINAVQLLLNPPAAGPVPIITQNPVSSNGVLGGGLELSVGVEGENLSIQWLKNGQPIGGATSSTLVFPALTESDAGAYSAAISNPAGRILTKTAIVNVLETAEVTEDLLVYFPFDDGSGTSAANAAGGENGQLMNGTAWGDGQIGGAVQFDGNDDYVFVADYPKVSEAMTVTAWVNVSSPDWEPIVRNWAPGTTVGRAGQFLFNTGFANLDAFEPSLTGTIGVGPNVPTGSGLIADSDRNSWHHVAMTADGAAVKVYWDGQLVGSGDYLGNINEPLFPWLAIGAVLELPTDIDGNIDFAGDPIVSETEFPLGGLVDDLAIWGRSLSGIEIDAVFSAGSSGMAVSDVPPVLSTDPLPGGPVDLPDGASIAINFGADEPDGARSDVTGSAGILGTATWTNLDGLSGDGAVVTADIGGTASASGATVSWTSNNTWSSQGRGEENNSAPEGNDRNLMTGYLDTNNTDPNSVTVTGLGDSTYDVVVYATGGVIGRGGEFTIGDQTTPHTTSAAFDGTFVAGSEGNYLVFQGVSGDSFTLVGTPTSGDTPRAPINGVEIVIGGGVPVGGDGAEILGVAVVEGNLSVEWQGSQILESPEVTGPYTVIAGEEPGTTLIPIEPGNKFIKVE